MTAVVVRRSWPADPEARRRWEQDQNPPPPPHPMPEVPAREAEPHEIPAGAERVRKRASEAGWRVSVTYARGYPFAIRVECPRCAEPVLALASGKAKKHAPPDATPCAGSGLVVEGEDTAPCPVCEVVTRLNKGNVLRKHAEPDAPVCAGSGLDVAERTVVDRVPAESVAVRMRIDRMGRREGIAATWLRSAGEPWKVSGCWHLVDGELPHRASVKTLGAIL